MTFQVETTNPGLVDSYVIRITNTMTTQVIAQASALFTLNVIDYPYLISRLPDMAIETGTSKTLSLTYKVPTKNKAVITFEYGGAQSFVVQQGQGVLTIAPTLSTPLGFYVLKVTIADAQFPSLKNQYSFKVKVLQQKIQTVTNTTNTTAQETANSTNSSSNSSQSIDPFGEGLTKKERVKAKNSIPLTPQIRSISNTGLMTIYFNIPVLIPTNFSAFNDSVIEVRLTPG